MAFTTTAAYVNSAANPLLYAIFNQRFRSKFKQLLTCGCFQSERRRRQTLLIQQRYLNCTIDSNPKRSPLRKSSTTHASSVAVYDKFNVVNFIHKSNNEEEDERIVNILRESIKKELVKGDYFPIRKSCPDVNNIEIIVSQENEKEYISENKDCYNYLNDSAKESDDNVVTNSRLIKDKEPNCIRLSTIIDQSESDIGKN